MSITLYDWWKLSTTIATNTGKLYTLEFDSPHRGSTRHDRVAGLQTPKTTSRFGTPGAPLCATKHNNPPAADVTYKSRNGKGVEGSWRVLFQFRQVFQGFSSSSHASNSEAEDIEGEAGAREAGAEAQGEFEEAAVVARDQDHGEHQAGVVGFLLPAEGGREYTKKNDAIRPFEGGGKTSLEFLSQKTDCSLFAFATHSKKRLNNLVLGRIFDHKVYDMVEIEVKNFKSIEALGGALKAAPQASSKPYFAFVGEQFVSNPKFHHFKELIVDFMRGEVMETITLQGLDNVFLCV